MHTQQQHWMARQGDVVLTTHVYNDNDELVPVGQPSVQATLLPRTPRGVVLQEGLITGHAHTYPGAGVALSREPSGARTLEVGDLDGVEEPLEQAGLRIGN